jgi:hypothetical protein
MRFTEWSWATGRDYLDVGFDLSVQPDRVRFGGQRFLVQVKGTCVKSRGRIVAPVSKSRLREYATSRTPIFVLRVTAEGDIYWIHAQAWCAANSHRISGDGESRIVFEASQRLDDCEMFSRDLEIAFQLQERTPGALGTLAKSRAQYLESLDARFAVEIELQQGRESYTITPKQPGKPAQLSLVTSPEQRLAAQEALKTHLEYGTPVELEVGGVRLSDSTLLEAVGASSTRGMIKINTREERARVRLQAGATFNFCAPSADWNLSLYRGTKGAKLESRRPEFLTFGATLSPYPGGVDAEFRLAINADHIASRPLRDFSEIDQFFKWSEAMLEASAGFLSIEAEVIKPAMRKSIGDIDRLFDLVQSIYAICLTGRICRFLESDFVFGTDVSLTIHELGILSSLHRALQGESVKMPITGAEVADGSVVPTDVATFYLITDVPIQVGEKLIGLIPIAAKLSAYETVRNSAGQIVRLQASEESSAFVRFNPTRTTEIFSDPF